MIIDFETMKKAFPSNMEKEITSISKIVPFETELNPISSFDITINNELIQIPSRIYYNDNIFSDVDLTQSHRSILDCYFTRHHNGFVREGHLNRIFERGTIEKWVIPYIIKLMGEYVVEILEDIYKNWELFNLQEVAVFINDNEKFIELTERRIVSYWNEYYRRDFSRNLYVGFKLIENIKYIKKNLIEK